MYGHHAHAWCLQNSVRCVRSPDMVATAGYHWTDFHFPLFSSSSIFNSSPFICNHHYFLVLFPLGLIFLPLFLHLNIDGKIIMCHCLLFRYRHLNYGLEVFISGNDLYSMLWMSPVHLSQSFSSHLMTCSSNLVTWVCSS